MATFTPTDITYFATPAEWRKWLAKHHLKASELWVGFYKKDSGKRSITWPESVDEALCVGWIDGIRKSLDEESYVIRFTPRKRKSVWSNVNVLRVQVLTAEQRMLAAGIAAFEARTPERSGIYAFERETAELSAAEIRAFKKQKTAWKFFAAQPPYYRRVMNWYVISAKRQETRDRRLLHLIEASAIGRRLEAL